MPLVRADLGLSYTGVGLLLGVPMLASAALEPVLGTRGDTRRRRALMVGGGVGFATGTALAAAATSFWWLLLALAVLAPASGAFVGLAQAVLMDIAPTLRDRNMSRWAAAGAAGALAGPLLVSASIALGAGWRAAFAALAAPAAVLAAAATLAPSPAPDADAAGGLRGLAAALRRRDVIRWLALLETADLLVDVMRGFLPLYLVASTGASPAQAALALTVVAAAELAGSAAAARLVRSVAPLAVVRWGAAAALVLYPAVLVAPSLEAKVVLVAAVTLTTSGWYPLLQARLYEALPGRSGTAMAAGSVSSSVAAALPLAIGVVAQSLGVAAGMWCLAAAPAILLVALRRR